MLSANRDPIVLYPGLFYADLIQCDDSCVDPEKQAGMLYSALTIQICITIIEYEYPVHSIYALIPRPSYGKFDAVRSTTYAIIPIIHAYTKYKVWRQDKTSNETLPEARGMILHTYLPTY